MVYQHISMVQTHEWKLASRLLKLLRKKVTSIRSSVSMHGKKTTIVVDKYYAS